MTSELFEEIVAALQAPRVLVRQVAPRIPDLPGMYALYGTADAVRELGIPSRDPDLPLYIGKADRGSLRVELREHLTAGRTPWSTVRRSLAALLRDRLELTVEPHLGAPVEGRVFGLDASGEERLTAWMGTSLKVATWAKPEGLELDGLDRDIIAAFRPPLVLRGSGRPWLRLQALRTQMATEAREARAARFHVPMPRRAPAWR